MHRIKEMQPSLKFIAASSTSARNERTLSHNPVPGGIVNTELRSERLQQESIQVGLKKTISRAQNPHEKYGLIENIPSHRVNNPITTCLKKH